MKKYGLIGYPLSHSFSQSFFNEKFQSEGIDAEYINFQIPTIENIQNIIAANPELEGLNVTIPYKEKIIPYLDEIDLDSLPIEAINVIKIVRQKGKIKLLGFNSDIIGFMHSIEPLLKKQHQKALVLGTGGAAKAIFHGLKKLGIEPTYVSRNSQPNKLTYDMLTPSIMTTHTVIVNCTPLGMYPKVNECPNIPYNKLTSNHLLYDLIYNPDKTLFMKKGVAQGALVKNGLEMLLLQAFASWKYWNK